MFYGFTDSLFYFFNFESLAAISQVLLDITQEMSVIGLMSDEIMENILCNLPIKEAFEASVLPKR